MLFAHRPLTALSPEDQCVKKQWARCVGGFYAVIALALFCLAVAVPSADPRSAAAQFSAGSQTVAQN
jgi:hypothetical protein